MLTSFIFSYFLLSSLYICRERSTNPPLFIQNKPNLPNARINVNKVLTKDYGNVHLHRRAENKPKTNSKRIYPQGGADPYGPASWNPQTRDQFQTRRTPSQFLLFFTSRVRGVKYRSLLSLCFDLEGRFFCVSVTALAVAYTDPS